MQSDRTSGLRDLLTQAEAAHGVYETTDLGGVYDAAWAAWYASFLVDRGIGDVLGREIAVDRLGAFLSSAFDDLRAIDPTPTESWAAYTARRIEDEL